MTLEKKINIETTPITFRKVERQPLTNAIANAGFACSLKH